MKKEKQLIIANWKMHPSTLGESKKLFNGIKKTANTLRNVQTVVCPPFVFLPELKKLFKGHRIALGGQNVFSETAGSFTGEVSPLQLKDSGATYVIVGHSERRAMGETNAMVNGKVLLAHKTGFVVVMCVGESERDNHGKYLQFLREQITEGLEGLKAKDLATIVIAYEPIWAIGKTGDDAITPQKLHETALYIRRVIGETYSQKIAAGATILYGGSVKPENAEELLNDTDVQGFLVGGASLNAKDFGEILTIGNKK